MEKQKVLNILKHLNDGKERGDDYLIGLVDGLFFAEEKEVGPPKQDPEVAIQGFVTDLSKKIMMLDAGSRAKEQPYLDGFNQAKAMILNRFLVRLVVGDATS